ncbi:MAG: hypothetical protein OK439_03575 [Thaumarchaeota archaeon]|nr:hypothetical protein [Nitrososphaerota archaeon]
MSVEIGNLEISGPSVRVNVSEAGDDILIEGSVAEEKAKAEMIRKLDSLQDGKSERVLLLTDHGIFIEGVWKVSQPQHTTEESGRLVFKITLLRK